VLGRVRRVSRAVARRGLLGESARRRVSPPEQPAQQRAVENHYSQVAGAKSTDSSAVSTPYVDDSPAVSDAEAVARINAAKERLKRERPPLEDED